jgi:hypothetical protein
MNYRLALAVLYVLLMAAVAAVLVYRLNPAVITAIPLPFVTLGTMTRAAACGVTGTVAQAAMSTATASMLPRG